MARTMDPWRWRDLVLAELGPLLMSGPKARASEQGDALEILSVLGGHLVQDIIVPEDQPRASVSAMDGYAVRFEDLESDGGSLLSVHADIRAGALLPAGLSIRRGGAARIMTGGLLPPGADTVIEVERTDASATGAAPATVRIGEIPGLARCRHVRRPGEEFRAGDVLAPAGTRVTPALIGAAVTLGMSTLPVTADPLRGARGLQGPRVAVLVTGDEVRRRDEESVRVGDVRDSNGVMLAAAIAELGSAVTCRRTGDDPRELIEMLDDVVEDADLVLTTGGIGMGAGDVVRSALGPRGKGSSRLVRLSLRPGSLQGLGTWRQGTGRVVPVLHLPGTPVAALVGFSLVVPPLLGHGELLRVDLIDDRAPCDLTATQRATGLYRASAGRSVPGGHQVELLTGNRLAPFALADRLVFREDAAAATTSDHRGLAWAVDLYPRG